MDLLATPDNPIPPDVVVDLVRAGRAEIRVARWPARPADARSCPGTVVICPGRGEFIEKYAEVVGNLLGRGFAVVAFDWRGQGGSSRLLANPFKGHVGDFADYQADLDAVGAEILAPFCPKPWFALAHSMGGTIVAEHAAGPRCLFDRIVLSAPMMEIYGLRHPGAIRALVTTVSRLGFGSLFVPRGRNRSVMAMPFEGNVLTSDPARYAAFKAILAVAPHLCLGAPTHGWVCAAFRAMARCEAIDFPRRAKTPFLVVACGADRVVENRATERFATRLKAGSLVVIPHARHEVLMEQDRFRDQFWAAFDRFIPGSLLQRAS